VRFLSRCSSGSQSVTLGPFPTLQAAASQEVTPQGPLPLHAGPSAKAGSVRPPSGAPLSPTEPRPEPQAHPQLLMLSQVGVQANVMPMDE
jgi:hypothetical protein